MLKGKRSQRGAGDIIFKNLTDRNTGKEAIIHYLTAIFNLLIQELFCLSL